MENLDRIFNQSRYFHSVQTSLVLKFSFVLVLALALFAVRLADDSSAYNRFNSGLPDGTDHISDTSLDNVESIQRRLGTSQSPHTMVEPQALVISLPGRIEAEDYQNGGQGVGYSDTTTGNAGGSYRQDDVDVEPASDTGGGYNVGWIVAGEWLDYDVDVQESGLYDFVARVASAKTGSMSFQIMVDGVNVTGTMTFSGTGGWQNWIDVTAQGIQLDAGSHELRIDMLSTDFNVNYVDVLSASPDGGGGGPTGPATIMTVDASQVINPFNDMMRGSQLSTWMHAALNKPGPNESANLDEVVSALKPGIIRYAGGLWANGTGWDRSNTIQEWAQPTWRWTDPETGEEFPYDYRHVYNADMIDSLAAFAGNVNADVMMQISICDNNLAMWTDLLRYTNIEHNYGFKYWELGNELTLDNCLPTSTETETIQEYARRYVSYRDALKAVDPSIQIMGPVPHQPWYNEDWFPPVLDAAVATGDSVDVVSWHRYPWWNGVDFSEADLELFGIASRSEMVEGVMSSVHAMLADAGSEDTLTAITELNTHPQNFITADMNHVGTMWMLDILPRLAYNGLDMNIWYNLYDDSGFELIYPDSDLTPSQMFLRPTYYGMLMLAQYFGDVMVKSTTEDPEQRVVVWATKDSKDPGALKLLVLNLNGTQEEVEIDLQGFTAGSGEYYELTSENPTDMSQASVTGGTTINGFEVDTRAGQVDQSIAAIQGRALTGLTASKVTHTVPAYSATAMILRTSGTIAEPPEASFTAGPVSGEAPLTVNFDATASGDPDGNIVSYSWDFNDGSSDSGVIVSHVFVGAGTYQVTLTVVDDDGLTDSFSATITVDERVGTGPVALTVQDGIVDMGGTITVPVVLSEAPDGISGFRMELASSNPGVAKIVGVTVPAMSLILQDLTNSGVIVGALDTDHTVGIGATGVVLVNLEVEGVVEGSTVISVVTLNLDDDDGFDIAVNLDSGTVVVPNVVPTVDAGGDVEIDLGDEFTRLVSIADPGDDSWNVSVDYGDGTSESFSIATASFTISHVYTQGGDRQVVVTVTDDNGATANGSFAVSVLSGFPILPGMPLPVQDLDGDGKAEDINGNGRLDFADIVTLFLTMDSPEVQDNAALFDFNNNGTADFADAVVLFDMIVLDS